MVPRRTLRDRLSLGWALPAAVGIFAAAPAYAQVTVTPAAKGYDIDIENQISAAELIDALAAATGANVKGQPQEATINPNHLRGASLERALRLLLPGAAFTLGFNADGKPTSIIFLSSPAQEPAPSEESDGMAPPMDDPTAIDGSSPDITAPDPYEADPSASDPQPAQ